jgi:hypothetical protein
MLSCSNKIAFELLFDLAEALSGRWKIYGAYPKAATTITQDSAPPSPPPSGAWGSMFVYFSNRKIDAARRSA